MFGVSILGIWQRCEIP